MASPKEVLSPKQYTNYRNVRAALVLFVFVGGILVFGGISLAVEQKPAPERKISPAGAVGMAVVGLAGVVGGVAALGAAGAGPAAPTSWPCPTSSASRSGPS